MLGKIVASGSTDVAAAGTAVPICGTYAVGTVALTVNSPNVVSAGGADFTAQHALDAAAGILFLKTNAGRLYRVESVSASANTLKLASLALATESAAAYNLYVMYDSEMVAVSNPNGNTGAVWVGDATVDKTAGNGIAVPKGETVLIPITGHADLWVDADTNGNDVGWVFLK